MKSVMIATEVKTVAASTGIDLQALGIEYGAGRTAIFEVCPLPAAAADADQVGDVQESDALATGYADLQAYDADDGQKVFTIALSKRYLRINNQSGTAGNGTNFILRQ